MLAAIGLLLRLQSKCLLLVRGAERLQLSDIRLLLKAAGCEFFVLTLQAPNLFTLLHRELELELEPLVQHLDLLEVFVFDARCLDLQLRLAFFAAVQTLAQLLAQKDLFLKLRALE